MSLYNKENPEYLRQSLNSIYTQSLKPDEVILVEDGPITAELDAVVNEYAEMHPEMKIIPLPVNGGLGNALNEGLKHCSYDLIARMDTDDISKKDRFQKQVSFMEMHPDIDCCSANIEEFIDETDNVVTLKNVPQDHNEIFKFGKSRCPINHPVVIYRKTAVVESGGYGPFPEDYYLWCRMLMNGKKFHNLQESLLYFRSSNDVFKRRGGIKYNRAMLNLQKEMYRISYISLYEFLRNVLIRSMVALIPNNLRSFFYKKFLRSAE